MTANYTFGPATFLPMGSWVKVLERTLNPGAYALFAVVSRASHADSRFIPIVGSNPLEVGYLECQLRNAAGVVLGATAIDNVYLTENVRTSGALPVNGGALVPPSSSVAVSLWCLSTNEKGWIGGSQMTTMRIGGFE